MKAAKIVIAAVVLVLLPSADGRQEKKVKQAVLTNPAVASSSSGGGEADNSFHHRWLELLPFQDVVGNLTREDAENRVREASDNSKQAIRQVRNEQQNAKVHYKERRNTEKAVFRETRENLTAYYVEQKEQLESMKDDLGRRQYRRKKAALIAENQDKMLELMSRRSDDKIKILEEYVVSLAKVELKDIKAQNSLTEDSEVVGAIGNAFQEIREWCADRRTNINNRLEWLVQRERDMNKEMKRIQTVMMENLCFEFWGVSGEIPDDQIIEFNKVMQFSLQQAFDELDADITVVAFRLVLQNFVPDEEHGVRRLGERRLGRAKHRLYVDGVAGLRCNCATDSLSSDVVHRGLGESSEVQIDTDSNEGFRFLTDNSVMGNFTNTVRDLAGGVFGELVSVNTLVCSNMKMPNPFE